MTTGTSSRCAKSIASCDAISPAPTTPTLVTVAGERLVGRAGGPLGAALDEVEGVEPGPELLAHGQLEERLALGRDPVVVGRGAARARSARSPGTAPALPRAPACRRCPWPRASAWSQASPRSTSGRSTTVSPRTTAEAHSSDSLEEVGGLEQHVGDAQVEGLLGLEHAVLVHRVLDDDRDGLVGADQVGQQLAAAPAGDQAEEDLGEGDGRRRRPTGCGSGSAARARGRRPSRRR